MFLPAQVSAQDTVRRSVSIGIDLLKNAWPLATLYPEVRSAYTVEPTLIIPLHHPYRYLHITPGFTRFSAKETNSSVLSGQGYYLKVGLERRKRNFGVGLASLITFWQDEGFYRFKGSYFGDYSGRIPQQNHLAVGGEFFISSLIRVKKRLAIRLQPRLTLLAPFTDYNERPDPPFLPGVGLIEGDRWKLSSGFSVQLIYRTSSN